MSSFGDEQLNYMAQTLEEIENYLGRISKSLETLAGIAEAQSGLEKIKDEWKKKY